MADISEKLEEAAPAAEIQDTQPDEEAQDGMEAEVEADLNPPNDAPADGINLDGANDAAGDTNMEAGIPVLETRIPAKKDASLREFLSKMDDYAPIVSSLSLFLFTKVLIFCSDTRRSDELLHDSRWSPSTTANLITPRAPSGFGDTKVHRRHCRRCISVQPDQVHKHDV